MARPLRIEYPGAWYHVMNRGLGRQKVFHKPEYFEIFYDLLQEAHKKYRIQIHAYCLMSNHYHLLIHTPFPNLGKALQYIDGLYTVRHNRLFGRDGPLFRGRYKAILIEADNYLLQLSRYIHLNPVSARIVKDPAEYLWSSYKCFIAQREAPNWLYLDEILKQFGQNQCENYGKFVLQGNKEEIKSFYARRKIFPILGGEDFMKEIKENNFLSKRSSEISEKSALIKKYLPTIEDVINEVAAYFCVATTIIVNAKKRTRNNLARNAAIYLSNYLTGENQKTIAKKFNSATYSAISQTCKRFSKEMKQNVEMAGKIELIASLLSNVKI